MVSVKPSVMKVKSFLSYKRSRFRSELILFDLDLNSYRLEILNRLLWPG